MSEKKYEFVFGEVGGETVVRREFTESQVRGSMVLMEAKEALEKAKRLRGEK